MPSVVLTSAYDELNSYLVTHKVNTNVVRGLVNRVASEAAAGWAVTSVVVNTTADLPYDSARDIQMTAAVWGTGEYTQNVTWSITGNVSEATVISADGVLTLAAGEFEDGNEDPVVEHDVVVTATSVDNNGVSGIYPVPCTSSAVSMIYNANTGTGTQVDASSPYTKGDTVTVAVACSFTPPAGKAFDRWAWNANGTGAIVPATFEIAANMVLYAIWKTVYTVNYDANGGTGDAPAEATFDSGTTITVAAANTFTPPTDKLFLKWNTAANGSGTDYAPAAEITAAADLVLYAQWKDTITSVTIKNVTDGSSDGTTRLVAGAEQFYATVAGVGTWNRDVTWSISGNNDATGTFISNNGFLVVGAGEFAEGQVDHDITVTATSVADPTISDTELVTCDIQP